MQANVVRGGAATGLALLHAFETHCDLLMVQESWIGADLDRGLSKKHNEYQVYGPEEVCTDRPRVITYAQRHQNGFCIQKRQDLLRNICLDILAIEVKVRDGQEPIHVVNVYNAPHGCTREEEAVTNVMNLAFLMQKHTIIEGDFNLHNRDWDQRTINPTSQAREFAE